ncbi:MAG TPA: hypothetical protein ENH86_02055 [Candidatus Jorgensenbacteria bacterium]|nr:hypothetical protein [Candidatus Jorgensenbacteria bacterium]
MNTETKQCNKCKEAFIIEIDDFAFYEKMGVPAPVLCPSCRFQRRCLFRNEMTLYNRTCALCGKSVISMYNPKSPYTVWCHKCWDSDVWDPYSYGQKYDPSRPFFEQLGELLRRVPKKTTVTSSGAGPNINSDYANMAGGNKNCYFVFNTGNCEETMYSRGLRQCRDTVDAYFGNDIERCYETVNVQESSGVMWGQNVTGSLDSTFLLNCSGCSNCFGCVNLRNKSYHFFNEPLSKDEYKKRVKAVVGSYAGTEEMRRKFEEFALKHPRRENSNLKTVNSTGNYLFESKNLSDCFEASKCEDCKYGFSIKLAKDSYDSIGYGYSSELLLECVAVGYAQHIIGSYWVEMDSQDVAYSFAIRNGKYCFGCDGLKGAEYCILNTRYEKEEYERLRERIVEELKAADEYGLFLPPALAPFAYNETVGQDNMPLTKKEALAAGFRWEDELQMTKGKETMVPDDIPDHIKDVPKSITDEVLKCVSCERNYRITPSELRFYQKMIIPVPRKCFYCRHADRLNRRGPMKIFDRTCDMCSKQIKTVYAPDRKEIVYCEQCYQSEIV